MAKDVIDRWVDGSWLFVLRNFMGFTVQVASSRFAAGIVWTLAMIKERESSTPIPREISLQLGSVGTKIRSKVRQASVYSKGCRVWCLEWPLCTRNP